MSVSRRRSRFYVIRFVAVRRRYCRSCRHAIKAEQMAWSPYWGGGQYHIACEALPTAPPHQAPPEDARRCDCGWYVAPGLETDECSRCFYLREQEPTEAVAS